MLKINRLLIRIDHRKVYMLMVEKKRFASHQILISILKDNQIKIFKKKIVKKDFFFEIKNFDKSL